ncbi:MULTISPECIES: A24 family peptidase [Ramlibacter]|uniref:Prepilin leader peptidase/N-methyltransferase n=1 Tax=Ramlibacter aquaticus TaxID=2780094 RepID=A0ABR9SDM0_9BURK|nr:MULTISPECIES: A24 family peptidase [Ramlibacter]MBE7939827.1 prepilin peptidase [Ramlibacter aquaticus]
MPFTPMSAALLGGLLGLLVGSFLNVVVYRLPLMMAREWWRDVAGYLGDAKAHADVFGQDLPASASAESKRLESALDALPAFDIARPRSRCPHCGHVIRWYENVPVLSWLVLRGKCSACSHAISPRYPLVELATAVAFALVASRFGITWTALAWAVFAAVLIAQFLIDFDTQLLPDSLNYPLLWLGLLMAASGASVPLSDSVWGAVAGYMSLWTVFQLHHKLTGKVGMGHGDFKLLAALGAWFGAHMVLALILLSSVVGAVVGGGLLVVGRLANRNIPMAFGPFIAGAGLVAMAVGPAQLERWMPFAFPF